MKVLLRHLVQRLKLLQPPVVLIIGIAYVLAVFAIDRAMPAGATFTLFYILGVAFVAWGAGRHYTGVVAVISTVLLTAGQWDSLSTAHREWITLWNTASRLIVFAAVGWLTAEAVRLTRRLSEQVEERTLQLKKEAEQHKATSARLAEALERFEQVTNNINEVFWLADLNPNRIAYISPGYERIWGRRCADLYQEPAAWMADIHPDDRQEIVRHAAATQTTHDVEYRILRPDGALRWIRSRAFPVRNEKGEVYRVAGIAEDITVRKQTEHASKTQAWILDNMAEGMIATELDGTIAMTNPAADRLMGYASDELLGRNISILSPFSEAETPERMKSLQAKIAGDTPWFGEIPLCRKDGSVLIAQSAINRTRIGERTLVVALYQNITRRKEAEAELRTREERLRLGLEAAHMITWDMDLATGSISFSEPLKEFFGGDAIAPYRTLQSLIEQVHPDDRERAAGALKQAIEEKTLLDVEYQARSLDGTYHWVLTKGQAVCNALGNPIRVLGVSLDTTKRKNAEEALRMSEERYRALAESAPDAIFILDREIKVQYANPIAASFWGRPAQNITGLPQTELFPPEVARRHSEVVTGIFHSGIGVHRETWVPFPAGQRCIETRLLPLRDQRGSTVSVMGVSRDITERKESEQRLAEALELNRTLIGASTVGIAAYRASGECILANKAMADLVGGSVEQLFQQNFRGLESWRRSRLLSAAEEVLNTQQPQQLEFSGTSSFGNALFMDIHFAPFVNNGEPHLLLLASDSGAQKRSEHLLKAQRDAGVRLSLTSDLKTALDALLDIAVQMEGIDCGGVYLLDPATGEMNLAAHRGVSAAFLERVSHVPPEAAETRVMREGRPIHNLREHVPGVPQPALDCEGLRAAAILPLCHEGVAVGSLNIASHNKDTIPEQSRMVMEAIAAQVAGAIVRIRAETALQQSEARLRAVITVAPISIFATDQDGIITFEEGQALRGAGTGQGGRIGRRVTEVYRDEPMILENVRRVLNGEEFSAVVEIIGGISTDCWYSPTRDREGNVTGLISVSINITERRRLERQILEISDREQARIGQDLHDGLCQHLVSIAFDANTLKRKLSVLSRLEAAAAERIADSMDQAISESRRLSRGLFPIRLEAEGLNSALEELARTTLERFQVPCRFENSQPVVDLDKVTATHLYRIAQEAVNNAVKHARPRMITISLNAGSGSCELRVEDDGIGLPPKGQGGSSGLGLHIMDYRARSIGGTLHLAPGPNGGTAVSCCVPRQSR